MTTLLGQPIELGKCYVFLKTVRTGSSTQRKVKIIGTCLKPNGRMQFECLWAEGYTWPIVKIFNLLDPKDVICEYTPVEGYRICEEKKNDTREA